VTIDPTPEKFDDTLSSMSNPFRGSIVGDPWKTTNDDSDVSRIHQRVFDSCCSAVDSARSNSGSAGLIIQGAPGSGKTHLIGRLRRRLTDDLAHPTLEKPRQAFAYVRLDTNAASLARHVRRRVADDLLRKVGGPNQFERLVLTRMMEVDNGDGHIALWWEHFRDERLDDSRDLLTELCLRESISPAFVEVLTHLVARRHRLDVMAWLRGDPLTPAAMERLGVAAEDTEDHPENVASRFLVDLMKLAGSSMPLVLCFDQVEALQTTPDDKTSIFTFGQLISQLHDADNNLVIISCMQSSLYNDIVRAMPTSMLNRICGYATESLNPLNTELASLVVSHRLQAAGVADIGPSNASGIWPLTEQDILSFVGKTGTTPRRLLDDAARRFDELTGRSTINKLDEPAEVPIGHDPMSDEWERRLEAASHDNDPKKSVNTLRDSISLLVHLSNPDWKITSDPGHDDIVDFVIATPDGEGRVGIKICDDSSIRLSAQLRKINQRFPDKLNIQKLVLLKDERSPISRNAVASLNHLRQIEVNGGIFHRVCPEAIAALDALKQLLADVKAGDLSFGGENVAVRTVIEWLRMQLPEPLVELAEILTLPAAGTGFEQPSIVERLQELLNERRICRAEEASMLLNRSTSELISAASERTDLFRVLDGRQPVIFSVRTSGACFDQSNR
jgi:hypothetical protein